MALLVTGAVIVCRSPLRVGMSSKELWACLELVEATKKEDSRAFPLGFKRVTVYNAGRGTLILITEFGIRADHCIALRKVPVELKEASDGMSSTVARIKNPRWEWPLKL